jgi:hypothetical protein
MGAAGLPPLPKIRAAALRQVNFSGGASHEIIIFMNGAAIDPSDVLFC